MAGVSVYHSVESERRAARRVVRWPCGPAGGVLCYRACAVSRCARDRSSVAEQGPFKPTTTHTAHQHRQIPDFLRTSIG